jgi:type VI secretion system protein ImpL
LRWQAIVRDLDRYQLKNPNSSLFALEQFVQTVAADPGAGDCIARFPARPNGFATGDYFSALHARLYDTLLARCGQGYADELRQQWNSFSTAFNQGVAGHPPFGVPGRGLNGDANTADFSELGQALRQYERVSRVFQQSKSGAGERVVGNKTEVRQFVDNFDQVDALLAPLYPADGAATGLDVSVEFRANRSNEVAANQVIDWTLKIGEQSVSLHDAARPLHWEYGTPVSLTLRFAKDSPLASASDPQQRAYSTDGHTLTWTFGDPWALISFINRQRVPDTAARGGNSSQLLKLEFPLAVVNAADEALLPKQSRGQVFVRLVLSPAGKKTALPWPGSFPTRAPEWTAL